MSDIRIARENLGEHSICLCKDGEWFTDDGRGISPMMRFLAEGRDLSGYSVADVIVGKAAAMLFVKAGIGIVYGKVMSESAREYLVLRGIPCICDIHTDKIINRKSDGICPMEQAVAELDDPDEGYRALQKRVSELKKRRFP